MVSSKAQKRKAKRAAKHSIDQSVAEQKADGSIPASVAVQPSLPDNMSSLDGSEYQLIFQNYNNKECELHNLTAADAKALVGKFATITKFNSTTIKSSNLIRDKIEPTGDYKSLYAGLEQDIELREIKFHNTGRIVAYLIDNHMYGEHASNYCCIVAVLTHHRNT
jgi:hypothetical protein